MSIETEDELAGLLKIGRVVAETLQELESATRPGISTHELDLIASNVLSRYGARSAPIITYGFPGVACISINDEAAHGIPGPRRLKPGDLVKYDVSAELDGFFADAAITVGVAPVSPANQKLIVAAKKALDEALAVSKAGVKINQIGKTTENVARRQGFKIIRGLLGHGVGRSLHEEPRDVPHFYVPSLPGELTNGMVLTIEPHLSAGTNSYFTARDGWTLKTPDHSPVANFEHTIVVTNSKPIIVTALQ